MSEEQNTALLLDEHSGRDVVLGGLFLALAIVVPFIFHAVGGGKLGPILLPMFLPIAMCGFLTRPQVALSVGVIAPLVSSVLTGMPPMYPPIAPVMCFEGAIFGGLTSVLYRSLRLNCWLALGAAAVCDRLFLLTVAFGVTKLLGLSGRLFTVAAVLYGTAGIALQFAIIPFTVRVLERRIGRGQR